MRTYLSIDIGGTFIKYALLDHSGQIIEKSKVKTPSQLNDFKESLNELVELYSTLIYGIAVSVPGKVDTDRGIVYFGGSLVYLDGFSFEEHFAKHHRHLKVAVQNDGKCAALAEWWLGSLKGIDNGAAIILGTGVGSGIIVNGALLKGSHFQSGELSFMVNDLSKVGNDKIVGYDLSAVWMIKRIALALKLPEDTGGELIFQKIINNDPVAVSLFENYCLHLAYLLLNVQTVVDLEKIVIGGGISSQPILTKKLNQAYDAVLEEFPQIKRNLIRPKIEKAQFENDANLYGAVYSLFLKLDE